MATKKKIVFDMVLNIVAVAIPTIVLQLFILPAISNYLPDDKYGLLVTLLAVLNVFPATLGNVLNNVRLLYNKNYIEKNIEGDFNILLLIMMSINILVVGVFAFIYSDDKNALDIILVIVISLLWLAKEYFIVAFRLNINYVAILINNILQVVGYGIGYVLFLNTGKWQWIYILGYILSLVYIFFRCSLWKERLVFTELFRIVSTQSIYLFIANLLSRTITYADKLLIYPILGGEVVSVYYAATVFGKVVSLAITPINAVALTYLAKVNKKSGNVFKTAVLSGTGLGIIGYIVCVLISRPVLTILYPQFVDQAMNYIYVTTATTVVYALISIVSPFLLKFFDMKWQIAINGISSLIYVVLSLVLHYFWGLMGFCVGALITNIVKFIYMINIYNKCSVRTSL